MVRGLAHLEWRPPGATVIKTDAAWLCFISIVRAELSEQVQGFICGRLLFREFHQTKSCFRICSGLVIGSFKNNIFLKMSVIQAGFTFGVFDDLIFDFSLFFLRLKP